MIDFRLKRNDGVQTAQQLRALPGYARVPMVACIAQGNETWASRCQCLGIRGCLIKTFQIKAIGECLEKTLHLSAPARAC